MSIEERLRKLEDDKLVEKLAVLYPRISSLEGKLVRARLEVVHIENARIANTYPELDKEAKEKKRKASQTFVAAPRVTDVGQPPQKKR
jgi:hypothetical protein